MGVAPPGRPPCPQPSPPHLPAKQTNPHPTNTRAVYSPIRYYLESYGQVEGTGEAAMMNEIRARGPLVCSIATPEDFDYGYHGGVAVDKTNSTDVDHDVEVVGWGVDDDSGMK